MQEVVEARESPSSPRLMVVDDDDILRASIAVLLRNHGFQVLECTSGQTALDALAREERPDLILLDLRMPHMDGWEFRQRQLAHAALASIPVIVMSADRTPQAATICAAAFVAKPMAEPDLLCTINDVLAKRRDVPARTRAAPTRHPRYLPRQHRRRRAVLLARSSERALSLGIEAEEQHGLQLALVARGLSHVVNNALQSLVGYVQSQPSAEDEDADDEDAALRRAVIDGAMHCAGVLDRFADCALPERTDLAKRQLGVVRSGIVQAWRMLLPPAVQLCMSELHLLAAVRISPSSLLTITSKLIVNAVEAMAQDAGVVHIRVSLRRRQLSDLDAAYPLRNRRSGTWCCLEVVDDGAGIPACALHQIWSPFYSTKFLGRGLGLSEVLACMSALGGLVEAESVHGSGATVRLLFPLAPAENTRP